MAVARSEHWDWWKGVAILAVIGIHASGSVSGFDAGSWQHLFTLVLRQFLNFAVPLFLALAGFFSGRFWKGSAGEYWRARTARIVPPYLIWTFIFVALLRPREFLQPDLLMQNVFLGRGIEIGYFVIVLLQYVVLAPALARLTTRGQHLTVMAAGTLLGLGLSYVLRTCFSSSPLAKFPQSAVLFIVWYPFFHFGFWVGRDPARVRLRPDRLWLWLAGGAAMLAIVEALAWRAAGAEGLAISQVKLTSFLASLLVFLHVVASQEQAARGAIYRGLTWLGRHSFALYLMHMLFLSKVVYAIRVLAPATYQFKPLSVAVATFGTALVCVLLVVLVKAIFPPAVQKNLLGAG